MSKFEAGTIVCYWVDQKRIIAKIDYVNEQRTAAALLGLGRSGGGWWMHKEELRVFDMLTGLASEFEKDDFIPKIEPVKETFETTVKILAEYKKTEVTSISDFPKSLMEMFEYFTAIQVPPKFKEGQKVRVTIEEVL